MITVKYRGQIVELTGISEEILEAKTVSELLKKIKVAHGKAAYTAAKRGYILVNGVSVTTLGGIRTKLLPKNRVTFLPICGGG